jgi:hypothetical protein
MLLSSWISNLIKSRNRSPRLGLILMRLAKTYFHKSLLLRLALLAAFSLNVSAQVHEEESKGSAPKTGAITGQVVNENGQPIPHATIYVIAQMAPQQPRTTITDDGGNFQVSGLDALVYSINVSAPSYTAPPRDPDTPRTYYRIGDSATISLLKGGVITGTVTSPTGEPLVQAGVRAILIRDGNGRPPAERGFPIDRITDDRGNYRIYGLPSGTYLVSAGGRGVNSFSSNAYETDTPTYAPSSTSDTAAEITVRPGEETNGVDIRYRGESGHAISGIVNGQSAPNSPANIILTQIINGYPHIAAVSYQLPNSKGFAIYGVADGDYDLVAQSFLGQGEGAASEARRIKVKGADIAGIELVVKTLASISGHLNLEPSTAPECKNKRQPLLSETLLMLRRSEKSLPKDPLTLQGASMTQALPDKSGEFALRNLASGQFSLNARFVAKYWYLRSITRELSAAPSSGPVPVNRQTDVARTPIDLKFGERVSGLRVTLAEGAASLRGAVKPADGASLPAKLFLNLVPVEKENAEDVLRFFTVAVNSDGTLTVNNLPPGRYWTLARVVSETEPQSDLNLRSPEQADYRTQIRRTAEAAKTSIELKPCQNVSNYELLFKISH